jgi:hypothetical protein
MDLPLVSDTIVSNASIGILSYLVSSVSLQFVSMLRICGLQNFDRDGFGVPRGEGLEDLRTLRLFVRFEMFDESNRIYRRTR